MKWGHVVAVAVGAVTAALTVLLYRAFMPAPDPDITGCEITSAEEYERAVYFNAREMDASIAGSVSKLVNFVWDTADEKSKSTRPSAPNLSLRWPPPLGSKVRLTAFPYPPPAKDNSSAIGNFARGMGQLLNNTQSSVSFPGWLISIYDPTNPNSNPYKDRFDNLGFNDPRAVIFGADSPSTWIEVLHACYPPPHEAFPTCDDGDYWMYMAPGSGVFWETGTRCIVCANKVDAICLLAEHHFGTTREDAETNIAKILSEPGRGGGMSLVSAMKDVINSIQQGKAETIKTVAFRDMQRGDSRPSWALFCAYAVTATVVCLGAIAVTSVSGYHAYHGAPGATARTLKLFAGAATLTGFALALGWYGITEQMLRGFGYCTLDQARRRPGGTVDMLTFVRDARAGKPYANGLCMTQAFDLQLEAWAKDCNVKTIIMHAQPNKSGNWAVEVMHGITDPSCNKKGLCGGQEFKVGTQPNPDPAELTPAAFSYFTPQSTCDCDPTRRAACTSCPGHISARLCGADAANGQVHITQAACASTS